MYVSQNITVNVLCVLRSCGKVMFWLIFVCPQGDLPTHNPPPRQTSQERRPPSEGRLPPPPPRHTHRSRTNGIGRPPLPPPPPPPKKADFHPGTVNRRAVGMLLECWVVYLSLWPILWIFRSINERKTIQFNLVIINMIITKHGGHRHCLLMYKNELPEQQHI